jgi:hypothetical protein
MGSTTGNRRNLRGVLEGPNILTNVPNDLQYPRTKYFQGQAIQSTADMLKVLRAISPTPPTIMKSSKK